MRIRIWNAFASNNSGSYVIVGRFPSEALAAEVTAELAEVAHAHTAWRAARESSLSPLAAYAARHGVTHVDGDDDDWPQYGRTDCPDVWAAGHQVFIHSDYTVTLPTAFGHLMYARGGCVETEVDHAHHPLVATLEIRWPWHIRSSMDVPASVQAVVDALCVAEGPLAAHAHSSHAPAWRGVLPGAQPAFDEPDLVIAVIFDDLSLGVTAVASAVAAAGATLYVRLSEAPSHGDPLAYLQPSVPQPSS